MNGRIQQLAIEAGGIWQGGYVEQANGDSVYTDKKFVSGGDMDVEQFARLLVKECVRFIDDENARLHEYTKSINPWEENRIYDCYLVIEKCKDLAHRLPKHFGVK